MKCPNCGETENFEFNITTVNRSGVVDGRLNGHDITPIAYMYCVGCSETLKIVHTDDIVAYLNYNMDFSDFVDMFDKSDRIM